MKWNPGGSAVGARYRQLCVAVLAITVIAAGGCASHPSAPHPTTAGPEATVAHRELASDPLELLRFAAPEASAAASVPSGAGAADPNSTTRPVLVGWQEFQFDTAERMTNYGIAIDDGRPVLRAHAVGGASALRHGLDLAPQRARNITWEWKIEAAVTGADITTKTGDDCAARIMLLYAYDPEQAGLLERTKYAVAKSAHGEYPPHSMLVYAWTEETQTGEVVESPYAKSVRVIPVRRGNDGAGAWHTESRNHFEDYRRAFGTDPPPLAGVAIMVDTDNTGATATAWFRSLRFTAD